MTDSGLDSLLQEISACRICVNAPVGAPLPHDPRPVLRADIRAPICICGQAPGTRVHASGVPFTDPSGDRLRDWMGIDEALFYDERRITIVPMGFCFPGLDAKGGDLPPRRECAQTWHARLFAELPDIRLILAVGQYAQAWHLGPDRHPTLTETVAHWRDYLDRTPPVLPLPHPSWRNNAWIKRNPWFEQELVPEIRRRVARLTGG